MATVVAFHAHPDDEVLLTGGTLARLAAEGHRTVVVGWRPVAEVRRPLWRASLRAGKGPSGQAAALILGGRCLAAPTPLRFSVSWPVA